MVSCSSCCGSRANDDDPETSSPPPPNPNSACYKLRQQELKAITPIFQPRKVITAYFLLSLIFIPLGAAILATNSNLFRSPEIRYDNTPACVPAGGAASAVCRVAFTLDDDVDAPVYLYYGLDNFFQNARDYVKSRSDKMNRGNWPLSSGDVEDCEPAKCREGVEECDPGTDGESDLLVPCGLTAASVFNDTFALFSCAAGEGECDTAVPLRKRGIAWASDVRDKFRPGPAPPEGPWTPELVADTVENEDFVVWMRLAAFKRFTKLYRIIEQDLPAGRYEMEILSTYPVDTFNGEKFFVLQQTGWIGGRNSFLGIAYVATGGVCMILAIVFLVRHLARPRRAAFVDPTIVREHIEALSRS